MSVSWVISGECIILFFNLDCGGLTPLSFVFMFLECWREDDSSSFHSENRKTKESGLTWPQSKSGFPLWVRPGAQDAQASTDQSSVATSEHVYFSIFLKDPFTFAFAALFLLCDEFARGEPRTGVSANVRKCPRRQKIVLLGKTDAKLGLATICNDLQRKLKDVSAAGVGKLVLSLAPSVGYAIPAQ